MVFDIEQFVADCRQAADQPDAAAAVLALMKKTVAAPENVRESFSPLSGRQGTGGANGEFILGRDQILFEDETVTVFAVDTEPGCLQPPHDHQMHAVIGVFEGIERNRFFKRNDGSADNATDGVNGLAQYGETSAGPGDVLAIKPDMIHAISAGEGNPCRALHVYLGSLSNVERSLFNPVTGDEVEMTEDGYGLFCQPDPA